MGGNDDEPPDYDGECNCHPRACDEDASDLDCPLIPEEDEEFIDDDELYDEEYDDGVLDGLDEERDFEEAIELRRRHV